MYVADIPDLDGFLGDVENHKMSILNNNGVNRHLIFKKSGTTAYQFEIVTLDGILLIRGDMGTYLFTGLEDMFTFFDREAEIKVHPYDWSRKCEAMDRHSGIEKWCKEKFQFMFKVFMDEYIAEMADGEKEEVDPYFHDILYFTDNPQVLYHKISEFPSKFNIDFSSILENNYYEYTWHYMWCLYAIVWGIKEFNKETKK